MSQVSCPSCKRKGTYSEKHEQCGACGLGYENLEHFSQEEGPMTASVTQSVTRRVTIDVDDTGGVTPVTPVTPVTEKPITNVTTVTPVTEPRVVRHSGFPPDPGEVCPLCDERKPSEKALKQRKWRAKQ